jgi:hypothetical protein
MKPSRRILRFIMVALLLCGQPARAEGLTGEIQWVSVPSEDKREQQSLSEISIYLEYEVADPVAIFFVGYHDQEFRSATLGLAQKMGDWQLGLGMGRAEFDDMNHLVINPWAYYADDEYTGYLHYESYRNGRAHSDFMKGYALRHFGAFSLGAHAEMDFGLGPRVEVMLSEGVRLWGVVPVAHKPTEGAMKAMIGLTAGF